MPQASRPWLNSRHALVLHVRRRYLPANPSLLLVCRLGRRSNHAFFFGFRVQKGIPQHQLFTILTPHIPVIAEPDLLPQQPQFLPLEQLEALKTELQLLHLGVQVLYRFEERPSKSFFISHSIPIHEIHTYHRHRTIEVPTPVDKRRLPFPTHPINTLNNIPQILGRPLLCDVFDIVVLVIIGQISEVYDKRDMSWEYELLILCYGRCTLPEDSSPT